MKFSRRLPPQTQAHSMVETLAAEHRQLVFWMLKESRKNHVETVMRLLILLIANCILLASLAIVPAILRSGSGSASLSSSAFFTLGEIVTAFLLVVSVVMVVYGIALISPPMLSITIPGERVPRQQVLNQVLADLARLRQKETLVSVAFRGAVVFLLLALLPYLFTIFIILP